MNKEIEALRQPLGDLSRPPEMQVRLFPGEAHPGRKLVEAYLLNRRRMGAKSLKEMVAQQGVLLDILDSLLTGLQKKNGAGAEIWTGKSLQTRPEWTSVRELANAALAAFHWEETVEG